MKDDQKKKADFDQKEREVDEYLSKRKNHMLTYFRGDNFLINLQMLKNSEQALKNLEAMKERNCELKIDSVSYRTLHHWDSMNLIECERETASSWRKFNVAELLWVHVILKYRDMGVSLDKVSKAKPFFFEKIPTCDLYYIDYYIIGALYFNTPTFFITLPDGQSEFLAYHEMTSAITMGWLNDCLLIHLNPLMNKIFQNIEIKSKFPSERPVTFEQHQICELIDQEEFNSIKIVKSKGKITKAHIDNGFSREHSLFDIAKNQINGSITLNYNNGVVTSRNRIKKVDII